MSGIFWWRKQQRNANRAAQQAGYAWNDDKRDGPGRWPWAMAMGHGHGLWTWAMDMGCGHGLWAWAVGALAEDPRARVVAEGVVEGVHVGAAVLVLPCAEVDD